MLLTVKLPYELLSPGEAASVLGLHPSTLEGWRRKGKGPPWLKLGPRNVAYRSDRLAEWLEMIERRPETQ